MRRRFSLSATSSARRSSPCSTQPGTTSWAHPRPWNSPSFRVPEEPARPCHCASYLARCDRGGASNTMRVLLPGVREKTAVLDAHRPSPGAVQNGLRPRGSIQVRRRDSATVEPVGCWSIGRRVGSYRRSQLSLVACPLLRGRPRAEGDPPLVPDHRESSTCTGHGTTRSRGGQPQASDLPKDAGSP